MAAETTPTNALSFRYDLNESGWNTGYDANWRLLEILLTGSVISATVSAEPGAPTDGDLYIVPVSATGTDWAGQDGDLAYYDGAASGGADEWVFVTPNEGVMYRAADDDFNYVYDGAAWVFEGPIDLGEYTVSNLPSAATYPNFWALATDASGGRTVVRSDGTNWKVVAVEGATVST